MEDKLEVAKERTCSNSKAWSVTTMPNVSGVLPKPENDFFVTWWNNMIFSATCNGGISAQHPNPPTPITYTAIAITLSKNMAI
jgi:hypothetical protein